MTRIRPSSRAAFTLTETLMSIAILGMVTGGIGSAMVIASRAIDAGKHSVATTNGGARAMQRLTSDVSLALSFTERTATAITFTVPDRDGDGNSETIRYAWSGVAGDPLTRVYNGGAVETVVGDIRKLNLAYLTQTKGPPPAQESAEVLLASCDPGSGAVTSFQVKDNAWGGEYIKPTLPANAVSWKITRVKVQLKHNASKTGNIFVNVLNADATGLPMGTALATASVDSNTVPVTATWVEFAYSSGVSELQPTQGVVVTVTATDTNPASLSTKTITAIPGMSWTKSTSSGSSWSTPTTTTGMLIYVYGTITTQGP